ncbi:MULTISPECIES: DUF397 domain-containing protein [Streptomyces]|uniref:DUF397 domain-containing protein n=1 Tax=Streptomyces TaxID=1883 RepID=UPI0037026EDA
MGTAEVAPIVCGKSSYNDNEGGECLEVAATPGAIHVRDAKDPRPRPTRLPALGGSRVRAVCGRTRPAPSGPPAQVCVLVRCGPR